jgi:O-methyltransferase
MTEEERIKEAERMYLVDAERLSKIGELLALDAERVAAIERFQALDADRVAALERYRVLDAHRVEMIERFQSLDKDRVAQIMDLSGRLHSMDQGPDVSSLIKLDAERVSTIERYRNLDADRVEMIERFQSLDRDRVAQIMELSDRLYSEGHGSEGAGRQTLDAKRVATIEQYQDLDTQRVETIERLQALDRDRVKVIEELSARLHSMDGITAVGRNRGFLKDEVFSAAWEKSAAANASGWPQGVPDVRWRAHIALWAARHGLNLEGDFVECGVHTGLLSLVVCHALKFEALPRKFFLFDTFDGIPLDAVTETEADRVGASNASYYRDVFDIAKDNFSPFPNAILVQGILPQSLADAPIDKIAYLSVDLNNVNAERGVIELLWGKLVNGAIVLIDDYDWTGCEEQKEMWDDFADTRGLMIATLPTGQGLLIKTE